MTIQMNNKGICIALAEQMMAAGPQLKRLESIFSNRVLQQKDSLPFDFCEGRLVDPLNHIPQQIGIWSPVFEGTNLKYYKRNKELFNRFGGNDASWSETEMLYRANPNKKTIIYMGESVARGFVFDPVVTPAKLLKDKIADHDYEIVDLACTGMNASALLQTVQEALELHPDMIVIHAGNNWWNSWWGNPSAEVTTSLIGLDSLQIKDVITQQVKLYITFILQSIVNLCKKTEVKLYFVLPEFNYAGWQNEFAIPAWLDDQTSACWLEHVQNANNLFALQKFPEMQAECNKALVLDNETSPLSLELMAKAEEGLGNTVIAKEYYIKAKNAVVWQYTTHTPRCPSFIEDLIREIIGQNPDCELIDLPEIFYQSSGKIIPDKTLFVDYVHHSLKGMDWVSDALASAITKKNTIINLSEVYDKDCAGSYLLAALHNANYGQQEDVIEYWLNKTLEMRKLTSSSSNELSFITKHYSADQKLHKEMYTSANASINKFLRAFHISDHSGIRLYELIKKYHPEQLEINEKNLPSEKSDVIVINSRNHHIFRFYPERYAVFTAMTYQNKLLMNEVNPYSFFCVKSLPSGEYEVTICIRSTSSEHSQSATISINGKDTSANLSSEWHNFIFSTSLNEGQDINISIMWPIISGSCDYHRELLAKDMIEGNRQLPVMRITGVIGQIIIRSI
ncbi:TPA: hypothetical protein L8R78_005111 [Klebsiella aerogenes]|nr:hypothetical protein [Klebsiella aerogenes]